MRYRACASALALCLIFSPSMQAGDSPLTVKASPSLLKQLKIETVREGEVHDSLRVSGRVDLDQQRVARIGATVTGRVVESTAIEGQEVRRGDTLAMLNSTDLGMAQAAYLKASSQVNLRRLAVSRARRLHDSDIIAAAELQEREAALVEAEVDLRSAEDQLRVLGMSQADLDRLARERTIHSFTPITASLSGTVIERNVTAGQVVQPSDSLFTVADLSHVWVVAEIPEQQAHWAREGDEALVEVSALPDQERLQGRLIYVGDVVNPETRTVTIRMDMANANRILKPQMLATLLIRKAGEHLLVVPDTAVVRDSDQEHLFIEQAPGQFELREVRLGSRDGALRRVLGGVNAGERIVVEGVFHLNNERLRKELE